MTDSDRFGSVDATRFDRVRWISEIGSTNSELIAEARQGEPEGAVLIADVQTEGRGRLARRWSAPRGTSLMMSILLRPPEALSAELISLITTSVALAARDASHEIAGVQLSLKWPNDLVVDGDGFGEPGYLKVAGILSEAVLVGSTVTAVVVGMGINTGWSEVPTELVNRAASLNLLADLDIDRTVLARRILELVEHNYAELLTADGPGLTLRRGREASSTLGRRVRVDLTNGARIVGLAEDLDESGRLIVTDDEGQHHRVDTGDVMHLRPVVS